MESLAGGQPCRIKRSGPCWRGCADHDPARAGEAEDLTLREDLDAQHVALPLGQQEWFLEKLEDILDLEPAREVETFGGTNKVDVGHEVQRVTGVMWSACPSVPDVLGAWEDWCESDGDGGNEVWFTSSDDSDMNVWSESTDDSGRDEAQLCFAERTCTWVEENLAPQTGLTASRVEANGP